MRTRQKERDPGGLTSPQVGELVYLEGVGEEEAEQLPAEGDEEGDGEVVVIEYMPDLSRERREEKGGQGGGGRSVSSDGRGWVVQSGLAHSAKRT